MRRNELHRVGLVLDDEPVTRDAVAVMLGRYGFRVLFTSRPATEVLPLVERERPDAIVMDIALTGVDGLAILSLLKLAAPGCVVVVFSPFPRLRHWALAAGAAEVLDEGDVRQLERCLADVRARSPAACSCCSPAASAGTSAPTLGGGSFQVERSDALRLPLRRYEPLPAKFPSDGTGASRESGPSQHFRV